MSASVASIWNAPPVLPPHGGAIQWPLIPLVIGEPSPGTLHDGLAVSHACSNNVQSCCTMKDYLHQLPSGVIPGCQHVVVCIPKGHLLCAEKEHPYGPVKIPYVPIFSSFSSPFLHEHQPCQIFVIQSQYPFPCGPVFFCNPLCHGQPRFPSTM